MALLTGLITVGADTSTPEWAMDVQEFIPQSYNSSHMVRLIFRRNPEYK